MDPQQELFTALLLRLKDLGYDVYDTFLPAEGTPYPFIYLADSRQTDTRTKNAVWEMYIRQSTSGITTRSGAGRYRRCCWTSRGSVMS